MNKHTYNIYNSGNCPLSAPPSGRQRQHANEKSIHPSTQGRAATTGGREIREVSDDHRASVSFYRTRHLQRGGETGKEKVPRTKKSGEGGGGGEKRCVIEKRSHPRAADTEGQFGPSVEPGTKERESESNQPPTTQRATNRRRATGTGMSDVR